MHPVSLWESWQLAHGHEIVAYGNSKRAVGQWRSWAGPYTLPYSIESERGSNRAKNSIVACVVHLSGSVSYLHAYITRTSDSPVCSTTTSTVVFNRCRASPEVSRWYWETGMGMSQGSLRFEVEVVGRNGEKTVLLQDIRGRVLLGQEWEYTAEVMESGRCCMGADREGPLQSGKRAFRANGSWA